MNSNTGIVEHVSTMHQVNACIEPPEQDDQNPWVMVATHAMNASVKLERSLVTPPQMQLLPVVVVVWERNKRHSKDA